jgi:hypothetical protein
VVLPGARLASSAGVGPGLRQCVGVTHCRLSALLPGLEGVLVEQVQRAIFQRVTWYSGGGRCLSQLAADLERRQTLSCVGVG